MSSKVGKCQLGVLEGCGRQGQSNRAPVLGSDDGVSLPVEPGKPEPTPSPTGSVLATQP